MKKTLTKRLFKGLLTTAVLLTATGSVGVLAQSIDHLEGANHELVNGLTPEQLELYAQLANAYHTIDAIKEEADQLQAAIIRDDKEIDRLNQEIEDLQAKIDKRQALIAEQAVAIQENGGTANYLGVLAASDSISDFVGRMDVIRKLVSANKQLLATQKQDKEAVEAKVQSTKEAKEAKINNMVSLEALKGDLEAQNAQADLAYQELAEDDTLASEDWKAIEAERAAFEASFYQEAPVAETTAESIETTQASWEAAESSLEPIAPVEVETTIEPVVEAVEPVTTSASAIQPIVEETTTSGAPVETTIAEPVETTVAEPVETTVAEPVETTVAEPVETTVAPVEEVVTTVAETTVETTVEQVVTPDLSYNTGSLIGNAEKYLGVPYVWGGKSPAGFDCSGFVQYVYRETFGKEIGGWTVAQESSGTIIPVSEAQAGDLYFWGSQGASYHVALATGGGGYIHAPQPGQSVSYGSVSSYAPQFALRVH